MNIGTRLKRFWVALPRRNRNASGAAAAVDPVTTRSVVGGNVELAPDDPIIAHLQTLTGAVEVDQIDLESPAPTFARIFLQPIAPSLRSPFPGRIQPFFECPTVIGYNPSFLAPLTAEKLRVVILDRRIASRLTEDNGRTRIRCRQKFLDDPFCLNHGFIKPAFRYQGSPTTDAWMHLHVPT